MPSSSFRRLLSNVSRQSPSISLSLNVTTNFSKPYDFSQWQTSSTLQLLRFTGFNCDVDVLVPMAILRNSDTGERLLNTRLLRAYRNIIWAYKKNGY